jgi:hypothetical protein
MNLDPKIQEAIRVAATAENQPPEFATKLAAWVDALTSGNERLDNNDSVRRHLELLYEAAKLHQNGGNAPLLPED